MKKDFKLSSRDPDEMAEFVHSQYHAPASVRSRVADSLIGRRGSSLHLDRMTLEWTTTIGDYDVIPREPVDANFIHFSQTGGVRVETARDVQASGPLEFSTFVGDNVNSVYNLPGSRHVILCMHRSFSSERLSYLLEKRLDRALVFKPLIEIESKDAARFARLVESFELNGLFDGAESPRSVKMTVSNFIFDVAIDLLPNNFSEVMGAPSAKVAPRQIRLAVDFMQANLSRVPSSDEIAAASGVGVRALQYSFKRHFGIGIKEHHRNLRLLKANEQLTSNPDETVEVIAKRLGFTNIGRFGSEFRKMFGDTPSSARRSYR